MKTQYESGNNFHRGDSRLATAGSVALIGVTLPSRPFVFQLLAGPWRGARRAGGPNRRVFGRLGQLLQVNGGLL